MKVTSQVELANASMLQAIDLGVGHVKVDGILNKGKSIIVNDKPIISFSNCSYLGLEFNPDIIAQAKNALDEYGSYFSSSRAFLELRLVKELEHYLSKIFGKPTLYTVSTTLGHNSLIPVMLNKEDALILDHRVHNSVVHGVSIIKAQGAHVELVRHNNLDLLESRIQKLRDKYPRVWYMADGVYSMLGDTAPVKQLTELMDKYENFYVYYDDAHGMSWAGKNGSGYVLNEMPYHPKMLLITSLAKGFGSMGGALVLPDDFSAEVVRNLGATLMFSGHPSPSTIAASIASAKIHLSNELPIFQQRIKSNIEFFYLLAKKLGLPIVSEGNTPIFFIGTGTNENAFYITKNCMENGFYLNPVIHPAVPQKNVGIRITLTALHDVEDLFNLLFFINDQFKELENLNLLRRENVMRAFNMAVA